MLNDGKLNSKNKGTIVEYQCALYLMSLGHTVSTPIGDFAPYDLIVDIEHNLFKVQCKYPEYNRGAISINCTTNINTRTRLETRNYSRHDVDIFATYYEDKCYLVPFDEVSRYFSLRFENTGNSSNLNVHWAENYEAEIVIHNIMHPDSIIDNTLPSRFIKKDIVSSGRSFYWINDGKSNRKFTGNIDEIPDNFKLGRCGRTNQFT